MRAVVQRVLEARVWVENRVVGEIGPGLLVFWGLEKGDTDADLEYLAQKVLGLRVFPDDRGFMNKSLDEVAGQLLVVSQFTLLGDLRRGRRPGFDQALEVPLAREYFPRVLDRLRQGVPGLQTGEFGADMIVDARGWGPVTLLLDSHKQF